MKPWALGSPGRRSRPRKNRYAYPFLCTPIYRSSRLDCGGSLRIIGKRCIAVVSPGIIGLDYWHVVRGQLSLLLRTLGVEVAVGQVEDTRGYSNK